MSPGYRSGYELRAVQPLISMAEQAAEAAARDSTNTSVSTASTDDKRNRREPEKTSRALVDDSDGRCELQRMRCSLDTNGIARGEDGSSCCPSLCHWWAETRDQPRSLSSSSCETKVTKSKLDETSPVLDVDDTVDLGATNSCYDVEHEEEDVATSSSSDWLEAAPKNKDTTKTQSSKYHSPGDNNAESTFISVTATVDAERSQFKQLVDGYEIERVYLAHVLFLDWRDLPSHRSSRKADRIWVLGATDREGRHRTRLLVVGREWRPRCLKRVNMMSQPVVYAGGGRGFLTPDLFLWWFHHEFAPTAMALHPNGAILVAQQSDHVPREQNCVTANGLVRLVIVPKHYVKSKLVAKELRTRLAVFLLSSAITEARINRFDDDGDLQETARKEGSYISMDDYIKRFTLKEAFAELHRAWLTIWPETFSRCWDENDENTVKPSHLLGGGKYLGETSDLFVLMGELRRLSLEAGLKIDEEDVQSWLLDRESECARCIEEEVEMTGTGKENNRYVGEKDEDNEETMQTPKAKEVVRLLSRVLIWMESEPLDPGFLLAVRAMRATAMFMVSPEEGKCFAYRSCNMETSRELVRRGKKKEKANEGEMHG